jgi:8-oxo-dGTP pyrophosphatase MutT (NUDIX family)
MTVEPRHELAQASAIPFRWKKNKLQFCLITSTNNGYWIFPKGMIDPGETPKETALKESEEEAGLIGEIVGEPLGNYTYSKWDQSLRVEVLLMHVHVSQDHWQEDTARDRCWVSLETALKRLQSKRLRSLLVKAAESLEQYRKDGA